MILQADARHIPLADGSVHCVVTSPPYWGLRDYGLPPLVWDGDPACEHEWDERRWYTEQSAAKSDGSAEAFSEAGPENAARLKAARWRSDGVCRCGAWRGCLGLEPTPDLYVAHMIEVFREIRRVLRDDGTCWLNLGDSYATGASGDNGNPKHGSTLGGSRPISRPRPFNIAAGLKPKDMVGIPWRVAFALQADGWWLRSDIIWSKPNPMPESVTDRPTKSHEYLFLMAKSERYYYDAEAIKEPLEASSVARLEQASFDAQRGGPKDYGNGLNSNRSARRALEHLKYRHNQARITSQQSANRVWDDAESLTRILATGRNRRTVWEIATQPYPEAHFATFPEALVEPCVLSGTSERGVCSACGAPWKRMVERSGGTIGRSWHDHSDDGMMGQRIDEEMSGKAQDGTYKVETKGWEPTCDCADGPTSKPLVLDPFAGSGTVGEVCHRLGRRFVGLDLKADYCRMAYARTAQLGLL